MPQTEIQEPGKSSPTVAGAGDITNNFSLVSNREMKADDQGTSVIEVLVAAAILLTVALAAGAAFSAHWDLISNIKSRMQRIVIQAEIRSVIKDRDVCSCLLDSTLNTSQATQLYINTTLSSPNAIPLSSIHSSCNFTSAASVVVRSGQTLEGTQLTAGSISIDRITPEGSAEYSANLRVQVNVLNGTALPPITAPVRFVINTAAGTPAHRRIAGCLNATVGMGPKSCPSGSKMVGEPMMDGSFCMDANSQPVSSYYDAVVECGNRSDDGYSGHHVCGLRELNAACSTTPGLLPNSGNNLITTPWAAGPADYSFWIGTSSNCNLLARGPGEAQYRCCFK